MKKFYSILAIAFGMIMCMAGEAKAADVTGKVTFKSPATIFNEYVTKITDKNGVTFSFEGTHMGTFDLGSAVTGGGLHPYQISKGENGENALAYLRVSGLENQSIDMKITMRAGCKAAFSPIHSCRVVSTSGGEVVVTNWAFDLGYDNYVLNTSNFSNGNEIIFYNGGGTFCLDNMVIEYTIKGEEEYKSVKVTPNNEVIFEGNWTAGEINETLQSPLTYADEATQEPVDVLPGQFGVVDLTAVTSLTQRDMIGTVNPNTIIAVTPDQPSVRPTNVLVMDEQDPYVENLVVVDPSLGTDTQSGFNYDEVDCGWYCTRSFTAKKASYTRPMAYSYGTVVLPFAYNVAGQSHQIEEITEVADETITSKRVEVEAIRPCQPVIVWSATPKDVVITAEDAYVTSAQGRDASTLIGTLIETTIGAGQYFIAKDNFWSAEDYGEIIVKPFRAWFEGEVEVAVKSFSINGESATAIKNVESATAAAPAYNLQGVRVAPNAKGFVIINGKKTYNK